MTASKRTRRSRRRRLVLHPGAAPGTVKISENACETSLVAVGVGPEGFESLAEANAQSLAALQARWPLVWIDVRGLRDEPTLREVASLAGMHRLALEDVVNTSQRAKAERFDESLFVVLRRPFREDRCFDDQIALVVQEGLVVTFRENDAPVFDAVHRRIREGRGRIRHAGPGYFAVALIDAVVDHYFPVLESIGESIDALEEAVMGDPDRDIASGIQRLRADLVEMRRALWPHRDALSTLQREHPDLIGDEARLHLRDVLDHVHQALDVLSAYRDNSSDLMSAYQTAVSNRMNEVMKVLTIIATIFIPLSFLTGLYGMNFDTEASPWNLPELGWPYGYPALWAVMIVLVAGMLFYFGKKGWLGGRD